MDITCRNLSARSGRDTVAVGPTPWRQTSEPCLPGGTDPLDLQAQSSLFEPMASTTLVRARVKSGRVKRVTRILDRMGLKPADVVNMVFAQIEQRLNPSRIRSP